MVERAQTQTGGDISGRTLLIGLVVIALAIVAATLLLR
jgi:hypothetical protein